MEKNLKNSDATMNHFPDEMKCCIINRRNKEAFKKYEVYKEKQLCNIIQIHHEMNVNRICTRYIFECITKNYNTNTGNSNRSHRNHINNTRLGIPYEDQMIVHEYCTCKNFVSNKVKKKIKCACQYIKKRNDHKSSFLLNDSKTCNFRLNKCEDCKQNKTTNVISNVLCTAELLKPQKKCNLTNNFNINSSKIPIESTEFKISTDYLLLSTNDSNSKIKNNSNHFKVSREIIHTNRESHLSSDYSIKSNSSNNSYTSQNENTSTNNFLLLYESTVKPTEKISDPCTSNATYIRNNTTDSPLVNISTNIMRNVHLIKHKSDQTAHVASYVIISLVFLFFTALFIQKIIKHQKMKEHIKLMELNRNDSSSEEMASIDSWDAQWIIENAQ